MDNRLLLKWIQDIYNDESENEKNFCEVYNDESEVLTKWHEKAGPMRPGVGKSWEADKTGRLRRE